MNSEEGGDEEESNRVESSYPACIVFWWSDSNWIELWTGSEGIRWRRILEVSAIGNRHRQLQVLPWYNLQSSQSNQFIYLEMFSYILFCYPKEDDHLNRGMEALDSNSWWEYNEKRENIIVSRENMVDQSSVETRSD